MMFGKFAVILSCAVVCLPAFGESLVTIGHNFQLDTQSISSDIMNGRVTFWAVATKSDRSYIRVKYELFCSSHVFTRVEAQSFSSSNQLLEQYDGSTTIRPKVRIDPASAMQAAAAIVCKPTI